MELETVLETASLFRDLTADERDALSRAMKVERYADGHLFIREGVPPVDWRHAVYVILDGKVLVTVDRKGPEDFGVVRLLEPGEVFGIVALVDDGARAATCRAAGPVTVASLTRQAFTLLYRSDLPVAVHFQLALARQLARDLRSANRELAEAMERGVFDETAARVVRT